MEDNKYAIVRVSVKKKGKKKKNLIEYLANDGNYYNHLKENTLYYDNFIEARNALLDCHFRRVQKYTYHVTNVKDNRNKYSIVKEKPIKDWVEQEGEAIRMFQRLGIRDAVTYSYLNPRAFWHVNSIRYENVLNAKSFKCVACEREIITARLEKSLYDVNNENMYHWNFYAKDGTMMTCDHIVPRSKGGSDDVENLQIMCALCNCAKDDFYYLEYDIEKGFENAE